jgi:putative restriction endonuclease
MPSRNLWTKEELILAFNLYLKIPFGKMHNSNKDIIHLASLINRTPSSVALRLVNFASVDPSLQARGIRGMQGGTKIVQPIWNEFYENQEELIYLSEEILANKENTSIENKFKDVLYDIAKIEGKEQLREVKVRVNQSVFRQIVLSNYQFKCAISNIDVPELLVASHIIPWSENETERLNPENGLCFSSLYDKAFDKGLIAINENYQVIISKRLKQNSTKEFYHSFFTHIENKKINLPERYLPNKQFIQYHLDTIFSKQNN